MGKQAREANRAARLEAVRAKQRWEGRRRTLTWVGAITAALLLATGGLTWAIVGTRTPTGALTGLTTYPNLSRDHVTGTVTYAQNPPAGGKHAGVWQNCGIYTQPVANEAAVHSLEHGAIWVTYRPDLPSDQITTLRQDVTGQPYGLLSPYPGLPTPVVATIWGTQLRLASADDPRLKAFIATYADATHAPEPRGECTGGTGDPEH